MKRPSLRDAVCIALPFLWIVGTLAFSDWWFQDSPRTGADFRPLSYRPTSQEAGGWFGWPVDALLIAAVAAFLGWRALFQQGGRLPKFEPQPLSLPPGARGQLVLHSLAALVGLLAAGFIAYNAAPALRGAAGLAVTAPPPLETRR